ncbi:hypothetical protein, partial [Streptomyces sp. NPDC008317]|uniref:hypothetical protein n=1 Tax=Streptomyces sp. NPDC008317 TaxID=3364827 RepID=UPI0036DFBF89
MTDVSAFTSPDKPDTATLVLNSYPFQAPGPAVAAEGIHPNCRCAPSPSANHRVSVVGWVIAV